MIASTRRVTIPTSPSTSSRNDPMAYASSSSSTTTTTFPAKLYYILQTASENDYEDVISWSSSDSTTNGKKSFNVHDKKRFAEEIMPIYFGSNKYRSFQKNLNMWGFKQATRREGKYSHPLFCRDSPQLIHQMKRQLVKHQIERLQEKQRKKSTTTTTETAMSSVRRPLETVMKVQLEGSPAPSQSSSLFSHVGTTNPKKSTSTACLPQSSSSMNDHLCAHHDYATVLPLPSKVAAASSTPPSIADFLRQQDGRRMNRWQPPERRSRIPSITTFPSSLHSGNPPLVLNNNIIRGTRFQSHHDDDHYDNRHQHWRGGGGGGGGGGGQHSTDEIPFSSATGSTASALLVPGSIFDSMLDSASAIRNDSVNTRRRSSSSLHNLIIPQQHDDKNEIQDLLRDIILIEKQLLLYVHEKQQQQMILQQKQLEFIMTELEIIEKLKQQCSNIASEKNVFMMM